MNSEITIFQATHSEKCLSLPEWIIPIQVGAANTEYKFEKFLDNIGVNISIKNPIYCELTALYWIWKNTQYQYIGLCHYRRVFLIEREDIIKVLTQNDIIVSKKKKFRISLKEQYLEAHLKEDWYAMLDVLEKYYPDYYQTSKNVFSQNVIYPYNMFITNKTLLDKYCEWLFNILFLIEERVGDISRRDSYQKRYIGFLAERLFTLYIIHNKFNIVEKKVLFNGKNNRIQQMKNMCNSILFSINKWGKERN